MRLNKRLLSFFFPFAFVFGVMAFMASPERGDRLVGVCAGICQALAFTAFAWKLSTDAPDESYYFPLVRNNVLVFMSWAILTVVCFSIVIDIYTGWVFIVLGILSLVGLCFVKTLRMSKQWMVVGDGAAFALVPPGKGVEVFWWESPVELSVVPEAKKVPLNFAILSELPLGMQVDVLTVSCQVTFVGGYGEAVSKTYSVALADVSAELSAEIQASVIPQPNESAQYSVTLPSDLLTVQGRIMDRFGYRIRVSLLHAI